MEPRRVGKFEKVSYEEFEKAVKEILLEKNMDIKSVYENIKIPCRGTALAAGYDFFAPFDIVLKPKETIKIPSGIRCWMEENYFLAIVPRSSFGFKFRLQLDNTIGIIDADFSDSKMKGHMMIKITNDTVEDKILEIKAGQGFVQGIFLPYAITYDDDVHNFREGGFGSTDKQNT